MLGLRRQCGLRAKRRWHRVAVLLPRERKKEDEDGIVERLWWCGTHGLCGGEGAAGGDER